MVGEQQYCYKRARSKGSETFLQWRTPPQPGHTAESYDAEVSTATAGLECALNLASRSPPGNIPKILDNEETAIRLHTRISYSSSAFAFARIISLCVSWETERNQRLSCGASIGRVYVRWCPGHIGIQGNEMTDQAAKESSDMESNKADHTVAKAKRRISELYSQSTENYWRSHIPQSYQNIDIDLSVRAPAELNPGAIACRAFPARRLRIVPSAFCAR